jgi:polygalacturonase
LYSEHVAETVTRVFNIVTGYGADPTSATDSKTAIQGAIDACSAAGGGDVYCPRGTYSISDRITMRSSVRLIGAGSMSIIKAASTFPANKQLIINATQQKQSLELAKQLSDSPLRYTKRQME